MTHPHRVHATVGDAQYRHMTFYRGRRTLLKRVAQDRLPVEPDREDWSVELPAVLWLLDQVQAGVATAQQARDLLVEATEPPGGCCWECEFLPGSEEEVWADCARYREQWLAWWNSVTAETHPYAVSQSSIHDWNCRHVTQPEPPPVITSKHQYMLLEREVDPDVTNPYRRLTRDEARAWLAPYRNRSRPPRCKVCAPDLPEAWRDETSDVPSTH